MAYQYFKFDTEDFSQPEWTTDIDPESIKRAIRIIYPTQIIKVFFLDQWLGLKRYNIQINDDTLIMDVYVPLDPYWKTLSEVATIEWIQLNTDIPVPKIIDY
jgi:hypothetical protein